MRIISSQDLMESYLSSLDEATAMRKRLGKQREAEIRQEITRRSNAPGTGSRNIDRTISAASVNARRTGEGHSGPNARLAANRRASVRDRPRNSLRYGSTYGKNIRLTPDQQALSASRGALRMAGTFTPKERQALDPVTKKRYQIKDEFELWVNSLVNEGYDLSDYTWEEAYEIYESYSDYLTLQAFLIGEGYADSIQESDYMIENMDEDLIEEILEEGYKKLPAHKMMRQASRRLTKHIAKHKEITPEFVKDDKKLSRDAARMYREIERHSLVKGKGRIRGEGQALLNRLRGEAKRGK